MRNYSLTKIAAIVILKMYGFNILLVNLLKLKPN